MLQKNFGALVSSIIFAIVFQYGMLGEQDHEKTITAG